MSDIGSDMTDKKIAELDREIHKIYTDAANDIQKKLDDFNAKHAAKEAIMVSKLKDGKITFDQFTDWQKGQIFQTEQWEAKRDQLVDVIINSNQIAAQIVNGQTASAFGFNATYMNYTLEHSAGVSFGFGIYDSATVAKLIKSNPQLLPKWKIDEKKDYIWNKKQVNLAVTQGIIQGEKLEQIADRISKGLVMKNENLAKTFARTAMTGAQNSGRLQSLKEAKKLGIEVMKEWMATLDSHTRDSHAEIDGEQVAVYSKFSNGMYYPAEAGGPPEEVYNCRCTMVGDLKKYPDKYQRYDNIDGKPIENMTYKEWAKAKGIEKSKKSSLVIDYARYGGKEAFDILSKYSSYTDFIRHSTGDEYVKILDVFGTGTGVDDYKVSQLIEEIKQGPAMVAPTPTPATTPPPVVIDYSAFGGKDIYDILAKFDSDIEFLDMSTHDEYLKVTSVLKSDEIKAAYKNGLKPVAVKPTTPAKTTTAKVAKKATTIKTTIEGALPRTASYIDGVTATGVANYGIQGKIDSCVSRVATKLGVSNDEARAMIETGLRRIVQESEFGMRIRARNLERVLDEGFFKNQHETGSSGGCLNTNMRKELEHKMFNVPKSGISDADRPVYGMFCPRWDTNSGSIKDYYSNGAGSWYGDGITVILRKERVINNATMTIGDSLDYEHRLVGTEVNNISFAGSWDGGTDLERIARITESSTAKEVHEAMMHFSSGSDHYFEYQLHGQESHSAENIDYVIIDDYTAGKNPDLLQKLDSMGIPYYINDA